MLRLPVVDGAEVCRRVLGDPELRGPLVVAVSALPPHEGRLRAADAGAHAYVAKPFSPDELLDRVREWTGLLQDVRHREERHLGVARRTGTPAGSGWQHP